MKEHPAPRTLLDLHLAGELIPTGRTLISPDELTTRLGSAIMIYMNKATDTAIRPEVTTAAFFRSHAEHPSGRGMWAFQASRTRVAFDRDCLGQVEFFSGTFTEASAKARKFFADATFVAVLG